MEVKGVPQLVEAEEVGGSPAAGGGRGGRGSPAAGGGGGGQGSPVAGGGGGRRSPAAGGGGGGRGVLQLVEEEVEGVPQLVEAEEVMESCRWWRRRRLRDDGSIFKLTLLARVNFPPHKPYIVPLLLTT